MVAKKEGLERASEARKARTVDLHYDEPFYKESVDNLRLFRVEMEGYLDPDMDAEWRALTEKQVEEVRFNHLLSAHTDTVFRNTASAVPVEPYPTSPVPSPPTT